MKSSRPDAYRWPKVYARNGSLENPWKFNNQDFVMLRERHLQKGLLFVDEAFPANVNIVGTKLEAEYNTHNIKWRRPPDVCKQPHVIVNGTSLFDIFQSQLGDCWVLSAIGSLTLNPTLLRNIMPSNQEYNVNYAGIFHFRLWHLGEWVDIVIDDMLPFLNDKYLSARPAGGNEFWPCLLEKAYAKLLGSYQNLHWGNPAEALVNLTGGLAMTFDLNGNNLQDDDLWHMISRTSQDTLMTCISNKKDAVPRNRRSSFPVLKESIDIRRSSVPTNTAQEDVYLANGLVASHAYCITDFAQVEFRNAMVKLIRLWNPWGHGEWKGNWNDRCPYWMEVREEDKLKMLRIKDDGQFWMSWEEFLCQFSTLIICNHVPDYLDWENQSKKWYKSMYWNRWTMENNSGNIFDKDSFCKNPQYIITVNSSDEVRRGSNVAISLMQSNRNRQKFHGNWLPMGFLMFKVDSKESHEKLPGSFFTPEKLSSIKGQELRDITNTYQLTSGKYVIIPYTTAREREFSFLLQVYLKSKDCTAELGFLQNLKSYEAQSYENIFRCYATKGSKMYAWDLHRILNDVFIKESPFPNGAKFTIDGSRELLASLDYAHIGKLDAENFGRLWRYLTQFKDVFAEIDTNRCGHFDFSELRKAVNRTGLQVRSDLLNQLIARYGDSEEKLNFVDYLICMIRLKTALKTFYLLSGDGQGVHINQDKWLQLMI